MNTRILLVVSCLALIYTPLMRASDARLTYLRRLQAWAMRGGLEQVRSLCTRSALSRGGK